MRESLRRAALCALASLSGAAGAAWAAAPDAPFDRDEVAVDNTDFLLLTEKGYSFDNEGILRAANRMTVSREDAAYILEDLRSRRRLADLLEIKLIQDRAASQGTMSAEDRASLRRIGQRDWPLLSKSSKEQLKSVFNDRELYELNARSVAPQPDAASLLPAPVRPSQAHAAVPLDQPLKAFSGALMPLGAQAPAPVRPYIPPAPVPAAPAPPPVPAAEAIPLDIKPLPAPWAVTPPPPPVAPAAPVTPVAPVAPAAPPAPPAPVIPPPPAIIEPPPPAPAPVPVAAPEPAPAPVPPPAPVAPPPPPPAALPAPAPVDPNAPAPLPTDEELEKGEVSSVAPAAPAAPPPTIVRPPVTDVTLASLPPAVAAAISAPPAPPLPAVAAVLPPAPPPGGSVAPGGFRVDAAAPPPVREAEGLSPNALPTTVVAAPPVAVPPPPAVALPAYLPVTPDAFSGFLGQAPYGREEKALLTMVSANLPEPDRTRALGVLMQRLPHVVLDSRRAGTESRVSVTVTSVPGQPLRETVVLHDGPVFRAADAFLKADQAWLLPDDPGFYAARGLSVPVAGAFSRESASAGEQATKWGRARVYPDGSKRLSRSETVLAGALARGLLLLDARVRIPGDPVGAELAARVGEFRLYHALEKAADDDPPLDKETMALYTEWRDRPMDFIDTMAHGFFAVGAGTRIAAEAGLGVGKEPLRPAPQLPAAGSAAEAAWLDSERLSREVSR